MENVKIGQGHDYLPINAVAFAKASLRFSLCFLLTLSASARPNWSLFFGSGILKVGPGVAVTGVSPPSKRKGVPSMLPQVIRGDASTPKLNQPEHNNIMIKKKLFLTKKN